MIKEIQAPSQSTRKYDQHTSIFLAGSIEEGKAEQWQKEAIATMELLIPKKYHEEVVVFNPRRDVWDDSVGQDFISLERQVLWELKYIKKAMYTIMYFSPGTNSIVSMYELGMLSSNEYGEVLVVCPDGYKRKGNVDIYCEEFGIEQFPTVGDAIKYIIEDNDWDEED